MAGSFSSAWPKVNKVIADVRLTKEAVKKANYAAYASVAFGVVARQRLWRLGRLSMAQTGSAPQRRNVNDEAGTRVLRPE